MRSSYERGAALRRVRAGRAAVMLRMQVEAEAMVCPAPSAGSARALRLETRDATERANPFTRASIGMYAAALTMRPARASPPPRRRAALPHLLKDRPALHGLDLPTQIGYDPETHGRRSDNGVSSSAPRHGPTDRASRRPGHVSMTITPRPRCSCALAAVASAADPLAGSAARSERLLKEFAAGLPWSPPRGSRWTSWPSAARACPASTR